jgi:hypothetical protein
MQYVYLLSDYNEYGSENVEATLDRSKLQDMLASRISLDGYKPDTNYHDTPASRLAGLLESQEENIITRANPHSLMDGWGGIQLHIVKLT